MLTASEDGLKVRPGIRARLVLRHRCCVERLRLVLAHRLQIRQEFFVDVLFVLSCNFLSRSLSSHSTQGTEEEANF